MIGHHVPPRTDRRVISDLVWNTVRPEGYSFDVHGYYIDSHNVRFVIRRINPATCWNKEVEIVVVSNNNSIILYVPPSINNEYIYELNMPFPVREARLNYKQEIPKKIFQTWKRHSLSKGMYNAITSIIDRNPEYEYYLYDDSECRDYIQQNFGDDIAELFDILVPGAFRADLWRYCILYQEGGVYIDADMMNKTPLRDVITPNDTFISAKDLRNTPYTSIYQAFIACTPKSPLIKATLDKCIDNIKSRLMVNSPLQITGPEMMGSTIHDYMKLKKPLHLWDNKIGNYDIKLLLHLPDTIYDKNNKLVFITKYSSYEKESTDYYYSLYVNNMVYKDRQITTNNKPDILIAVLILSLVIIIIVIATS